MCWPKRAGAGVISLGPSSRAVGHSVGRKPHCGVLGGDTRTHADQGWGDTGRAKLQTAQTESGSCRLLASWEDRPSSVKICQDFRRSQKSGLSVKVLLFMCLLNLENSESSLFMLHVFLSLALDS